MQAFVKQHLAHEIPNRKSFQKTIEKAIEEMKKPMSEEGNPVEHNKR